MATALPCKRCQRKCKIPKFDSNGALPVLFVNLRLGSTELITKELINRIFDNNGYCDGDMSLYCLGELARKLIDKLYELIDKLISSKIMELDKCYEIEFESIDIKATCRCNDADIEAGKGPPTAKIDVELVGPSVKKVPCPIIS